MGSASPWDFPSRLCDFIKTMSIYLLVFPTSYMAKVSSKYGIILGFFGQPIICLFVFQNICLHNITFLSHWKYNSNIYFYFQEHFSFLRAEIFKIPKIIMAKRKSTKTSFGRRFESVFVTKRTWTQKHTKAGHRNTRLIRKAVHGNTRNSGREPLWAAKLLLLDKKICLANLV